VGRGRHTPEQSVHKRRKKLPNKGPVRTFLATNDQRAGSRARTPPRADLADELRGWPDEKLKTARHNARLVGRLVPLALSLDEPLLNVPQDFVRILDCDLVAGSIPKRDERGRTVDIHALRHTFGTQLSKTGVAPPPAQAAMRHSSLDLTTLARPGEDFCTDPSLLDVAGALEALSEL